MIGRRSVSRRQLLGDTMGLAAAWELQRAAWAGGLGQGTTVCSTVAAEQEVGPYYVANELLRADIREGKSGVPILLRLAVLDARRCTPLEGAAIDVWHCDAMGLYAGYTKMNPLGFGPGGPPPGFDPSHPDNHPGPPEGMGPPPPMQQTDQLTFLRGIQFTNTSGRVEFATIFPGFYMGRTNHIHFKVREGGRVVRRENSEGKTYMEGHTCHTGQVFFPEELAAELMRQEPYSRHRIHRTTQAGDMIFNAQHGGPSMSRLRPLDAKRPEAGYISELIVAVDPSATPDPVGPGGPKGSPRPPSE